MKVKKNTSSLGLNKRFMKSQYALVCPRQQNDLDMRLATHLVRVQRAEIITLARLKEPSSPFS